jgi:hypothetical protein
MLFLIAVLTCSGITVYSNYQISPFSLSTYPGTNSGENSIGSEVNTSEDDQIRHSIEVVFTADLSSPILITQDYSLILKFSCSIWQPPKISR